MTSLCNSTSCRLSAPHSRQPLSAGPLQVCAAQCGTGSNVAAHRRDMSPLLGAALHAQPTIWRRICWAVVPHTGGIMLVPLSLMLVQSAMCTHHSCVTLHGPTRWRARCCTAADVIKSRGGWVGEAAKRHAIARWNNQTHIAQHVRNVGHIGPHTSMYGGDHVAAKQARVHTK